MTTFGLDNFESFDPPSRGTGISSAVLRYRAPKLPARAPIAHITNHVHNVGMGDLGTLALMGAVHRLGSARITEAFQ